MARVVDVADYIISHTPTNISTMKLQKLVYYCQAWGLVWDEKPLFNAPIEAWANGPVVPELYRYHRGNFIATREMFDGDGTALTANERETVDAVLEAYGGMSGQHLSDLTHQERPWVEARGETPVGERSSATLSLDVMQDYYGAMLAAAEPTRESDE